MTPVRPTTRADGQIDAACQDDEGHADRDDADDDGLIEQIEKIVRLEEVGREQRQGDRDDDRERQHPQFERRRTQAETRAPGSFGCMGRARAAPIGLEISWVIASRGNGPELRSASPPPAAPRCRAGSPRRSIPVHGRDGCARRRAGFANRLSGSRTKSEERALNAVEIGVSSKRGAEPALSAGSAFGFAVAVLRQKTRSLSRMAQKRRAVALVGELLQKAPVSLHRGCAARPTG